MAKGWDHDPPAKRKWTPLGILMVATGALTLLFGSQETSDFWVDGLQVWWARVSDRCRSIRRLVVYLDNGPKCSGTRTQFLKRMVAFADWSGLEVRLVYYPPIPQQIQPGGAVLVEPGEEVGRGPVELPGGDPGVRSADDLEGTNPDGGWPDR